MRVSFYNFPSLSLNYKRQFNLQIEPSTDRLIANPVPSISSYQSMALAYLPQPDGVALIQSPDILAMNGQYAKVPMIIGDQEDEGTLFSLNQHNISTTDKLVQYFQGFIFHDTTLAQIQTLVSLYPTTHPPTPPSEPAQPTTSIPIQAPSRHARRPLLHPRPTHLPNPHQHRRPLRPQLVLPRQLRLRHTRTRDLPRLRHPNSIRP
jgi:carboxylesterase type B